MASEAGVLPFKPEDVKMKGRLQPGKHVVVDTVAGPHRSDEEIKERLAARQPYAQWLKENQITLDQLPEPPRVHRTDHETILSRQRAFGYTDEDLHMILTPMAVEGEEPVGSHGHRYAAGMPFRQAADAVQLFQAAFAQVTNPPIDPIREELVMSLTSYIGTEAQHPRRDAAAIATR